MILPAPSLIVKCAQHFWDIPMPIEGVVLTRPRESTTLATLARRRSARGYRGAARRIVAIGIVLAGCRARSANVTGASNQGRDRELQMERADLSYYVYRLGGALAPRVPPRFGYWFAASAGSLIYRISPARSIVEDNMAHILGLPADSPAVRCTAGQVFRNQIKNYFDLLRVAALSPAQIEAAVPEIHGLEHLHAALARGRGVVLTSAHFGSPDLAAQALALRGYPLTAIAEHLKPERLFRYVWRQRASHGVKLVPIDKSLRPAFRALRANELVGAVVDRNVTDQGRLVEFFGRPARLPDGYVKLALHTGAAVVLSLSRRLGDNTVAVDIEPVIEVQRTGDQERDIEATMPGVISRFEAYLRRYPEQWVYFQPVWVSAPGQARAGVAPAGESSREAAS